MPALLLLLAAAAASAQTAVSAAQTAESLGRCARLASLELTALFPQRSEGRAVLAVCNPFAAAVRFVSASCVVRVNGKEIGGGSGRGRTLRAHKKNAGLEIPFSVEHDRFLTAAGDRWAVGADVDARVTGSMIVRAGPDEVSVPFDFSDRMGTDGARSGVFSHSEGATSMSPRR